jgi:hypothetical protein
MRRRRSGEKERQGRGKYPTQQGRSAAIGARRKKESELVLLHNRFSSGFFFRYVNFFHEVAMYLCI